MPQDWSSFFPTQGLNFLKKNIQLALEEDGPELTAKAIFNPSDYFEGHIVAKEATLVVGLPLISLTLESLNTPFKLELNVAEGDKVPNETLVAKIQTSAYALLKAERVILNYISHLSGIANLTARYVKELEGTSVRLLDTRKTTPGLRWPEKYAVQMGGGYNHRMDLASMLMLKDNHIDTQGSILKAVEKLRNTYNPCPPIEVECRNLAEVAEAVKSQCERIMLDNMDLEKLKQALPLVPKSQECEVSGGVNLENIRNIALIGPRHPDFISVGRLTHSAKAADFSLRLKKLV